VKYREGLLSVIVARMVSEGAFELGIVVADLAFEDYLRCAGDLKGNT
jgi:hypothetical protein